MGYTPPIEIDIGSPATDRETRTSANWTTVNKNNPANEDGKITSVEILANEDLVNCEVATFFVVAGNNLSTRGTHYIGSVTAGSKQTFSGLNIDVKAGDFIGIFFTVGKLEADNVGDGMWQASGDNIPCENLEFIPYANITNSLYGKGATGSGELTIGESLSVLDSWVVRINLSEAFSIVDSLVKNVTKQLGEAFSIVDSKVTKILKALDETFSIVDSFTYTVILHFYEALSIKDSAIAYLLSLWHKVTKKKEDFIKVEKETADGIKVNKEKGDWTKPRKE